MTEGTPYPPEQPGQPAQPGGFTPPPQATPPASGYPPPGGYPPPATPAGPGSHQQPAQQYPQQPYQPYPQQAQPQPFPQAHQSYQTAATPPAKKRSLKKILFIVALVLGLPLLGIGACTFFVISTFRGPVNESNDFLALLDNKQFDAAYASFDPACTSEFSAEDLRSSWDSTEIDGYDLKNVSIVNSSADVSGSISLDGASPQPIEFTLNKRDGDWKVCSFSLR